MSATGDHQFVTLGLGAETFAVPVSQVREILDYAPPAAIPNAPPYLLGLTDVRGTSTPTLDLRRKLGLPPIEPTLATRILVVDLPLDGRVLSLGLVADRVLEVVYFDPSSVTSPPDIGTPWRSRYIQGVVRHGETFVVIFNLVELFAAQDVLLLDQAA